MLLSTENVVNDDKEHFEDDYYLESRRFKRSEIWYNWLQSLDYAYPVIQRKVIEAVQNRSTLGTSFGVPWLCM